MKRIISVFFVFLNLAFLCSCNSTSQYKDELYALDTIITFDIRCDSQADPVQIVNKCKEEIIRLERLFSATDENSDVYRINNSNGKKVKVSEECAQLIRTAFSLSKQTESTFDISVYELTKLWGFDKKQYKVPSEAEISDTLLKTGYENIQVTKDNCVILNNDITIDLGGIAKGYIARLVCDILKNDEHIIGAIISFGGMIVAIGENPDRDNSKWTIGVEYPDSNGEYFASFSSNGATTSGSYQRFFEQDGVTYHHILDSKTGKPSDSDISSVTIVGSADEYSDAFSTAFFVMGIDKTIEYLKFSENAQLEQFGVIILNAEKNQVYVTQDVLDNGFQIEDKYKDIIKIKVIS